MAAPTANPDEPRKLPLRLAVAASGNLHPGKTSMFEPIHGSAPKYAGKNVACPLGGILAVSMMLDYLGEKQASASIERAVAHLLASGRIPSADACSGVSTTETGEMVVQTLQAKLALG